VDSLAFAYSAGTVLYLLGILKFINVVHLHLIRDLRKFPAGLCVKLLMFEDIPVASSFSPRLCCTQELRNPTLAWLLLLFGIWLQISKLSKVSSLYRLPGGWTLSLSLHWSCIAFSGSSLGLGDTLPSVTSPYLSPEWLHPF